MFVFPDLNTGNTTYKAAQRSARVVSVAPMLQGLTERALSPSPLSA
nr:phosphate acyltransferase [Halomonas sp. LBP4]